MEQKIDEYLNLVQYKPPKLGELNGRIVVENDEFMIFFVPGRTVYVDSSSGSQYQPAEYVLLAKQGKKLPNSIWVRELLRFRGK